MHSVSVIIRCRNEERFIGETLRMVGGQRVDVPFEIVVVDSGSTDRTIEIVGAFGVRLFEIPPASFTFGYALNYGIDRAQGSIICNTSAHCVPSGESWLRYLVEPILKSQADATFGRQLPVKGLNAWEEVLLQKDFPDTEDLKGRLPFSNANCAFLRSMWAEMKFDEELQSWEDYLWYLRQKDRYRFLYRPEAAVFHSHPFSVKGMVERAYRDGMACRVFERKYGIDLMQGSRPTAKAKMGVFLRDLGRYTGLFRQRGYWRHMLLIPYARFLAYRAYWKGYRAVA